MTDDNQCPTCNKPGFIKPTSVITVRMKPDLHRELKLRASAMGVSLNQLCVAAFRRELKYGKPTVKWDG